MKKLSLLLTLILSLCLLCACSSSLSSTEFYLLPEPQRIEIASKESVQAKHIAIMPVGIPSYLERSEILLKAKDSPSITVSQDKRWAESLDSMIQRLVAISLSNELASNNVIALPLTSSFPIDYRLSVDISLFEADLNSEASLSAYWNLRADSKTIAQGKFNKSLPVSHSFEELLEVQSALIQEMTKEIARVYKELAAEGKKS